ncbi:MmcQ/YjbR family DNA-binding protein [Micromonospora krabiensis]|uniref:YjbR protein n=1 Tax=Micromonospora krabiensis TaxID=307121 RepID=A0A1C3MWJ4_9ACTN|nr:MmcQ/YjbR family DNA-binding protein [Micromonospora krabiensis]SBV24697.1 YjbR protein [Micromonospora krabiensis]
MSAPGDVPPEILDQLRPICRRLPEAYEEPAWIGVRWRIRKRTFVHVYTPRQERHWAYARHPIAGEPPTLMTFRAPANELLGLTANGFPFFRAEWGRNVAGALLGDHTDWTEIAELITDSYCEMAPKFLVTRVAPPSPEHLIRSAPSTHVG